MLGAGIPGWGCERWFPLPDLLGSWGVRELTWKWQVQVEKGKESTRGQAPGGTHVQAHLVLLRFTVLCKRCIFYQLTRLITWFHCGAGEDASESLGQQGDRTSQSKRRSTLNIHWKDWCWSWNSNILVTWWEELTHWKRPWCWERLRAGGEGDDRERDGWMASLTQWTYVLNRFSRVWLFVTLWTVARQASLSMGSSRQEYWSELPFPPPGDLPKPGMEPTSLMSPASVGMLFTPSATWEALSLSKVWEVSEEQGILACCSP